MHGVGHACHASVRSVEGSLLSQRLPTYVFPVQDTEGAARGLPIDSLDEQLGSQQVPDRGRVLLGTHVPPLECAVVSRMLEGHRFAQMKIYR